MKFCGGARAKGGESWQVVHSRSIAKWFRWAFAKRTRRKNSRRTKREKRERERERKRERERERLRNEEKDGKGSLATYLLFYGRNAWTIERVRRMVLKIVRWCNRCKKNSPFYPLVFKESPSVIVFALPSATAPPVYHLLVPSSWTMIPQASALTQKQWVCGTRSRSIPVKPPIPLRTTA